MQIASQISYLSHFPPSQLLPELDHYSIYHHREFKGENGKSSVRRTNLPRRPPACLIVLPTWPLLLQPPGQSASEASSPVAGHQYFNWGLRLPSVAQRINTASRKLSFPVTVWLAEKPNNVNERHLAGYDSTTPVPRLLTKQRDLERVCFGLGDSSPVSFATRDPLANDIRAINRARRN